MPQFVEDVRGLPVHEAEGNLIGSVVSLEIDASEWTVTGILVEVEGEALTSFTRRHPRADAPVVLLDPRHVRQEKLRLVLTVPYEAAVADVA